MKTLFKKLPLIGPLARTGIHILRDSLRKARGTKPVYQFVRQDPTDGQHPDSIRVMNILNYTKTSESAYNGGRFTAGYHSLHLGELELKGQREPMERIKLVPVDFTGLTVLDIGCNQGGMLYPLSSKIAHGIGIDFDSRLINAANRIKAYARISNLDFYVFNLEKEDLNLIKDFLPEERVDVVFLLAVCMWIDNWKEVIRFAKSVSKNMLFETNGKLEQQREQVTYLESLYSSVQLLSEQSTEDQLQRNRRLYLCS
ncbi:MAG TPA: class I SAM-dependent methyltransferase [Methylophilaceae bacterium]|nr:class I SAM-dependent methyltransferase [Methylophilaceae bacterium]